MNAKTINPKPKPRTDAAREAIRETRPVSLSTQVDWIDGRRVDAAARRQGITRAEFVRRAVKAYLREQENEAARVHLAKRDAALSNEVVAALAAMREEKR